jgi:hypothetical protein
MPDAGVVFLDGLLCKALGGLDGGVENLDRGGGSCPSRSDAGGLGIQWVWG